MKILKLCSILMVMMFSFISCETEPYEGAELKATTAKGSNDDNGCETGFAICASDLTTCFLDSGFNRWGWTLGPVSTSTHLFGIFAGAAKCDTDKGQLAGTVELDYDATTGVAIVKYVVEPGFGFQETHLYIGNEPFPMQTQGKKEVPTVAPGQYPYKHGGLNGATTDTYTVDGLSGEIYLIAHSVVCTTNTDTADNAE